MTDIDHPTRTDELADYARTLFSAFDAKDVATLTSYLTENVRLRLGNAETVEEKSAWKCSRTMQVQRQAIYMRPLICLLPLWSGNWREHSPRTAPELA